MSKKTLGTSALPHELCVALKNVGHRLQLARKRRELTQEALAGQMFISRQTVAKIEKGDPSVAFGLYMLAAYCMGLSGELTALFLPENDQQGLYLETRKWDARQRIRSKVDPRLDF